MSTGFFPRSAAPIVGTIVVVLALAGAGYYRYRSAVDAFAAQSYEGLAITARAKLTEVNIYLYERQVKSNPNFSLRRVAIENALRNIAQNPKDAQLRLDLGVAEYSIQDYAGAERSFLEAQRLAPHATAVLWDLVKLYEQTSRYGEAERWAKFAIEKSWDTQPEGYVMLGELYEQYLTAKRDEVQNIYAQGWEKTRDVDFLRRLAKYWSARGDSTKAIDYYNQWLAHTPPGILRDDIQRELDAVRRRMPP